MPKPRVLTKYEVDESRCILCGICVDACPYDALRDGNEFELSHTSRENPMIDLMALAAVDRETEMTYVRKERDWLQRATNEGRLIDRGKLLPVLPASLALGSGKGGDGGSALTTGHGPHGGHDGGGAGGTHAHAK
ncbi:MAG: hypothetical protein EPO36_13970 [Chloroflexota bacterium]|nr:MAG: hypothetical protein EPO36_13970 [Chloroflexota bacterium]